MAKEVFNSPKRAPEYVLYRDVNVVDSADSTVKAHGMNMAGFRFANIQVVPDAGQNPTTEVMFWSEEADKFIKEHVALIKTGIGSATPYEFSVDANGRIFWVKQTVGTGKIFVSGWEEEHR